MCTTAAEFVFDCDFCVQRKCDAVLLILRDMSLTLASKGLKVDFTVELYDTVHQSGKSGINEEEIRKSYEKVGVNIFITSNSHFI